MNRTLRLGAAMLAVASLSACATVTRGTKQKYAITSEPSGAAVALTTGETCVTPCKLKLKRKNEFTAKITKDGYQPYEARVESKFRSGGAAGMAGNLLIGGIIGGAVDASNGSMNTLMPTTIEAKLVPAVPEMPAEPVAAVSPEAPVEPVAEPAPAEEPAPPVETAAPTAPMSNEGEE